jgi:short subunit dehydrogenase-like uncharacterized protein
VAGRIVVFGATGFTGRLAVDALVARGSKPVLAGRQPDLLKQLSAELSGGELETQAADVERPDTVRALVEEGDVLVSAVGPFNRLGDPALQAAVDAGAHYIDSNGEPLFIQRVFDDWGPRAEAAGCGLLTAFGHDYVSGNLAGALALEDAGEAATKVSVGYSITGSPTRGQAMSGGSVASSAEVIYERSFAYRDGQIVGERPAKRVRSFEGGGKRFFGMSVGASEHYALPRVYPQLRDVDAYIGWAGPALRALQAFSLAGELPGVRRGVVGLSARMIKGSSGGPDAEVRAKTGSLAVAEAEDAEGNVLARAELEGPNGYALTGDLMAWGAAHAAKHGVEGSGALGPVDGFGLRTLEAGCAEVGLKRTA